MTSLPTGAGHRYVIGVHALDVPSLRIPPDATPAYLMFNALGHVVGRAFLTATSER